MIKKIAILIAIFCLVGCTTNSTNTNEGQSTTATKAVEYDLLYLTYDNNITSNNPLNKKCILVGLNEYLKGGIVNKDGTNNTELALEKYPIGQLSAKVKNDFFYTSASVDPYNTVMGVRSFNVFSQDQNIWSANFMNQKTEKIVSNNGKFPSIFSVSGDNKYIAYSLNDKKNSDMLTLENPYANNADLALINTESKNTSTIISNDYNRQLLKSFHDFSVANDYFFTLQQKNDAFKLIKVSLIDNQITAFPEIYPEFNWQQINWQDFFTKDTREKVSYFQISPDETKIAIFNNGGGEMLENKCGTKGSFELWLMDLKNNALTKIETGDGNIEKLDWKNDSSEFAYALNTACGCTPAYMDAYIYKYSNTGTNKTELVSEKLSKINGFAWSPDDANIGYSIYDINYQSKIKTIDPQNKNIIEVTNIEKINGQINKNQPTLIHFKDWVKK